jgi:hypothetical protein
MVTNTRKILNPAATNKNNGVFLKVMANARNIGCNLKPVSQTNSGNLTES